MTNIYQDTVSGGFDMGYESNFRVISDWVVPFSGLFATGSWLFVMSFFDQICGGGMIYVVLMNILVTS